MKMMKINKTTLKQIIKNINILENTINHSKKQLSDLRKIVYNIEKKNENNTENNIIDDDKVINIINNKKGKDMPRQINEIKSNKKSDDKEEYTIKINNKNMREFIYLTSDCLDKSNLIEQSYFNSIINSYLIEQNLIENNFVKLNSQLKELLGLKKRRMKIDTLFSFFLEKCNI
jgi:hypothetical protein